MQTPDYQPFYQSLRQNGLGAWLDAGLAQQVTDALQAHGSFDLWAAAIAAIPELQPSVVELNQALEIGRKSDCDKQTRAILQDALLQLHPWRKGPYALYGLQLETEWRSDWKWNRLKNAIAPLTDRRVLDVGCGNGYHCWRMLGAGAKQVVGLDPMIVFVMQFWAIHKLLSQAQQPLGLANCAVLPLGIERLPSKLGYFDTLFSMGVLYHRRSPFDHLWELREALRSGGELLLETLVIDGKRDEVLVPPGRYAQMRNVWFLPSVLALESWLKKAGFRNIRLLDVSTTTVAEQRTTAWMAFHSLSDFLDPTDPTKTIEGHPAPQRAIFSAETA